MTREGICAPTRFLLFVLSNRFLQQLDVRGTIFGMGFNERDMNFDSPLSRAITNHPSLHALLLDPNHFRTQHKGPVSPWTRLLTHAITKTDVGGQNQDHPFTVVIQPWDIARWTDKRVNREIYFGMAVASPNGTLWHVRIRQYYPTFKVVPEHWRSGCASTGLSTLTSPNSLP